MSILSFQVRSLLFRALVIGNWELGIGNWELGIGHWAFPLSYSPFPPSLCTPVAHGGDHATLLNAGNPRTEVAPQDRAGSPLPITHYPVYGCCTVRV
ncbi:hypothetical protein [Tolypothrix sp. VBCCA 56010]|uniref:hypothetical protein n=1 Tax=Tolypothrix sp. VBCCA 56010 TaxID=3137731 RepID=UPI003D7D71C6